MCEWSYTVGPQLYQVTLLPSWGTNTSFFLVRLLNSSSLTSVLFSGGCQAGWVRLQDIITLVELRGAEKCRLGRFCTFRFRITLAMLITASNLNLSRNFASLNYDENSTLQNIFSTHMHTTESKERTRNKLRIMLTCSSDQWHWRLIMILVG